MGFPSLLDRIRCTDVLGHIWANLFIANNTVVEPVVSSIFRSSRLIFCHLILARPKGFKATITVFRYICPNLK